MKRRRSKAVSTVVEQEHHTEAAEEKNEYRTSLDDIIGYVKASCQTIEEFVDKEQRALFAEKLFEECYEKVYLLAGDQKGSKILDKICDAITENKPEETIAFATKYFESLSAHIVPLSSNCYGSRILERLLQMVNVGADDKKVSKDLRKQIDDLLLTLWTRLSEGVATSEDGNIYIDIACHATATHVLRSLILSSAGCILEGEKQQQVIVKYAASKALLRQLDDFCQILINYLSKDRDGLLLDTNGCPLTGLFLQVYERLRGEKKKETLLSLLSAVYPSLQDHTLSDISHTKLEELSKDERQWFDMILSKHGSRIIEVGLHLSTSISNMICQSIFTCIVPKKCMEIACDVNGTFVVNSLLKSSSLTVDNLTVLISSLSFEAVIAAKREGVLWNILLACKRLHSGFKESSTKLFHALDLALSTNYHLTYPALLTLTSCKDLPEKVKEAFIVRKKAEEGEVKSEGEKKKNLLTLSPIGCSIAQVLLSFPKETIQCMISGLKAFVAQTELMLELCYSNYGSRVLENVFDIGNSNTVPSSVVEIFIKKLGGHWVDLSCHTRSAFVVTSVYRVAPLKFKEMMTKELSEKSDQIKAVNYKLWVLIGLKDYIRKGEKEWKKSHEKQDKHLLLFKDIINDNNTVQNTKKVEKAEKIQEESEDESEDESEEEEEEEVTEKKEDNGVIDFITRAAKTVKEEEEEPVTKKRRQQKKNAYEKSLEEKKRDDAIFKQTLALINPASQEKKRRR